MDPYDLRKQQEASKPKVHSPVMAQLLETSKHMAIKMAEKEKQRIVELQSKKEAETTKEDATEKAKDVKRAQRDKMAALKALKQARTDVAS